MEFNKINNLLNENKELKNVFNALKNNVKGSKLLEDIILFLNDENPLLETISDNNKVALVSLMKKYYMSCSETFLVNSKIDKLIDGAKEEIYNIQAPSGIRVATSREVENGVVGLIAKDKYVLGEKKYKLLCLLQWTIDGKLHNYRKAGYAYEYDKERNCLADSIYKMIARASDGLIEMMDWVGNATEFKNDMRIIKKEIKNSYKYPDYAADEVKVDISVKQLKFYLNNNLSKYQTTRKYKEALRMIIKDKNDKYYKLTPMNISFLRGIYTEIISGMATEKDSKTQENNELRNVCEQLINNKGKLVPDNHFAFKIIGTIQKSGYTKCSAKQRDIIDEAYKLLRSNQEVDNETDDIENDDFMDNRVDHNSILDISNALGSGAFLDNIEHQR